MLIQKKELIESLKLCMPGIETGSAVLQGADSFIFKDGWIYTYNDVISVMVPLNQKDLVDEKIEGCVKAEEFFKIVSKLPSDDIKFSIMEDGNWLLKCGKAKVQMTLLDFDFESRLKNIIPDEKNWIDLSDDFVSGLSCCRMSGNKSQLSGIYFSGNNIVSTDGNQMNFYTGKDVDFPDFWITDNSANELLKFKKFTSMKINGNWVHFKTEDGSVFSVKTLQAQQYPFDKIKTIIDASDPEKAELHHKFPKELFSAIDRAVSFSMEMSESSNVVRLTISKDKLEVFSERSSGKYVEKVSWDENIEKDFEPFIIYVDVSMMQFMANKTTEFYLLKGPVRNGKSLPRLLFVTESSKHLISTFNKSDDK